MAGQAGWYRAPGEDGLLRYWNGTAWTEHRQPAPAAAPVVVETSAPVAPVAPIAPTPLIEPSASELPTIQAPTIQAPTTQRHVATEPLVPQPTAVVAATEPDWSMDQFEKQFEEQFRASSAPEAPLPVSQPSNFDAVPLPPAVPAYVPVSRFAPQPTDSVASIVQVESAPDAPAAPGAATTDPSAQVAKASAADAAFAASTVTADVQRVRRNRRRVLNPVRGMVVGLLFILVGAALIFLATTQNNPPSGELRANGIITSLGSPKVGCAPVARFAAAGGSYTTHATAAISPCPVELGQSVNVFYTLQHPGTTGEISSPSSISTIDWAVAGIGVVLLIGSFILFIARAGSVSRGVRVIREGELAEVAASKNRP